MIQITGAIITFNEEKNIARCIDSISAVVDEIVVVDSFSTDKTKEICESKGVRFIKNKFESYISQKNFALKQAKFDVILSLDADEWLSERLTKSILEVKIGWKHSAYKMNRLSFYGEKAIKHGSWYPDKQLRLWDRRIGEWGGDTPHERVILKQALQAKWIKGDILHRSYRNSFDVLNKIQMYSDMYARNHAQLKSVSTLKILSHFVAAFMKSYLLKLGFMDGYEGFVVAVAIANHTFYKYAKAHERVQKD